MSGVKKMSLKRILAVAGTGAALAGLLVWGGVAQKKAKQDALHYVAGLTPTTYVCDTIDVACPEAIDQILFGVIYVGSYDRMNNVVHKYHYRDLTGTEMGQAVTGAVNQSQEFASYHELRHAYNSRLMWRYDGVLSPDVFVMDEVSARVAEELARISEKKPMKSGKMSSAVSYKISDKYNLQNIANMFVKKALVEIEQTFEVSADIFEEASLYAHNDPLVQDVAIDKKTLMNEMMVFEINGKKQNMLKLASKELQKEVERLKVSVEKYLDVKYR